MSVFREVVLRRGVADAAREMVPRGQSGCIDAFRFIGEMRAAFPSVPMRTLLESQEWFELSRQGTKSDEWLTEHFRPWI